MQLLSYSSGRRTCAVSLIIALLFLAGKVVSVTAQTKPVAPHVTLVPIQVIQLANDDGSRLARVTRDEMDIWVRFANSAFAPAGIRFTFADGPKDLTIMKSSLLNVMNPREGKEEFKDSFIKADEVAAGYPGHLTIFVRWGSDPKPTGAADSGQDWNFVIMGAYEAMHHCGHAHVDAFAHEIGHYFGLAHTFVRPFASIAEATQYLRYKGNDPNVFDGDGLTDTPPDPAIRGLECERVAEITLNGVKFVLPRHNLMSYYDERDTLSPQQIQRVRWMLEQRLRNHMLIPTNKCANPIEAESLKVSDAKKVSTGIQPMAKFGILGATHSWSNDTQLFIRAEQGGSLALTFQAPAASRYSLDVYLTQAPDFGIGQFSVDGKTIGNPIDGYGLMVMPSGKISLGTITLQPGDHHVELTITGKNRLSTNYNFGIDAFELTPAGP